MRGEGCNGALRPARLLRARQDTTMVTPGTRNKPAKTSSEKTWTALEGRPGLLLLVLIATIQLAGLSQILREGTGLPGSVIETPVPVSSQVSVIAAWLIVLVAWYRHSDFDGWPTILAASGGFCVLMVFIFGAGFPMLWMARFVLLENTPPWEAMGRVSLVALYPLLVHPLTAEKIQQLAGAASVRFRPWVVLVAFLLVFPPLCWFLRSVNISRDGYQCIEFVSQDQWHQQLREPLTLLLHRVVGTALTSWPGLSEQEALGILSCVLGIPVLLLLARTVRIWSEDTRSQSHIPFLMALASGGFILLWFGHIEVYPVLVAGICLLIFLVARYLTEGGSLLWLSLVYGLLFPFHLSVAWFLPAMVYLFGLAWKREGPAKVAGAVGIIVLVQILIWGSICVIYHTSIQDFAARFWSEMNVGPDKAMFHGWAELFSIRHAADIAQGFIYLSLPVTLGFVLLALRRPKTPWSPLEIFLGLAALGYAVYAVTWRADRGYPEDWDLFSALVPLTSLVVGMRLVRWQSDTKRRNSLIYLVIISSIPLLAYQFFLHTQLDTYIPYQRHLRLMRDLGIIK